MKRRVLALFLIFLLLCGCGGEQSFLPGETGTAPKPPSTVNGPDDDTAETTEPPADEDPSTSDGTGTTPTDLADQILAGMTLHEKLCQLFCITPEQLTGVGTAIQAGETTRQALEEYPVGGLVYFSQNIDTPEQITTMLQNTQSYAKIPLFLGVDEEGGTVSRVAANPNMGLENFPAMGQIGATGDTEQAYLVGSTIGGYLRDLGFNLDFAPVADVNSNPNNTVIGQRAFSSDALVASQMVATAVQGFTDSGILCCLKHFPGHGDTATDSHLGYAQTDKTLQEMEQLEFLPFVSGIDAGAPMVMVGHITAPNVTDDGLPASLSAEFITGILRQQLGFTGVVTTDALNMGAITQSYSPGEAAVAAISAGVDLLLMPEDFQEALNGLTFAVEDGTISESRIDESVLRILRAKIDTGILTGEVS